MRPEDVHALLGRFAPRIAEAELPAARTTLEELVAAHPREPEESIAARFVARSASLLAPAPIRFDPGARSPALARVERRLRAAVELAGRVPPELLDGVPISWTRQKVDRPTIVEWWRRWLATHSKSVPIFAYVHVPFCRTRCSFCQFASVIERGEHAPFLANVLEEAAELERALGPMRVDAATIGGGTPSSLSEDELKALLDGVLGRAIRIEPGAYFSVEMNPDSATAGKVAVLAERGVNRISLGVQSLHAPTLAAVARGYQTEEMVREAVEHVRRWPDVQLSLDLLAPLPEETLETFRRGFEAVLDLVPDQVVLYRYQPVRRGKDRTILPGAMPYDEAAEGFLAAALERGFEAVSHTGSSVVVQLPGARRYRVRYVQHPREPTAVLGLGPFAESHVFGVGRYVAGGDTTDGYLGEEVSLLSEQVSYVGRKLGADLPLDEAAFRATFGRGLVEAFPDALAYLEEAKLLRREPDAWSPAFASRDEALRRAWVFLDEETLHRLRAGPAAARAEDVLARAGELEPSADRGALRRLVEPLVDRLTELEVAALVRERGRSTVELHAELALDGLGTDPAALDRLLREQLSLGASTARLVGRLLCDGALDRPRVRIAEAGIELTAATAARLPEAIRALVAVTESTDAIVPNAAALEHVERVTVGPGSALSLSFEIDRSTSRLWSRVATALPASLAQLAADGGPPRYVRDGAGSAWLVLEGDLGELAGALASARAPLCRRWEELPARTRARSLRVPLLGARPLLDRAELRVAPIEVRSRRLPVAEPS